MCVVARPAAAAELLVAVAGSFSGAHPVLRSDVFGSLVTPFAFLAARYVHPSLLLPRRNLGSLAGRRFDVVPSTVVRRYAPSPLDCTGIAIANARVWSGDHRLVGTSCCLNSFVYWNVFEETS